MKPTKAEKLKDLLQREGEVGKILGPDVPALGGWCVPLAPVLPGVGSWGHREGYTAPAAPPAALASSAAEPWLPPVTENTRFSCHSSEAERRAVFSSGAYSEGSSTAGHISCC